VASSTPYTDDIEAGARRGIDGRIVQERQAIKKYGLGDAAIRTYSYLHVNLSPHPCRGGDGGIRNLDPRQHDGGKGGRFLCRRRR
jgi:hypothetical protein